MNSRNSTIGEHRLSRHFLVGSLVFKFIFILCGVFGNLAVILYQVFLNKNKAQTSFLVINLAIADLLTCLIIFSTGIVAFFRILYDMDSDEEFGCKLFYSSATMSVALSTLTLLAISYDRYVFIRWPLRYPLIITWRKIKVFIITIWLLATACVPVLIVSMRAGDSRGVCHLSPSIAIVLNACYNSIPMCVIFFLHFKIFQIARRHRRRITMIQSSTENQGAQTGFSRATIKKELRSIKTFGIIVGALLCCLAPFAVVVIVNILVCNSQCVPTELVLICGDLIGVNSIINPCIYGIRQKECKNAFRRLILSGFGR